MRGVPSRPAVAARTQVPGASVAVVREFFVALGARDGGAVGALFADEALLDVPGIRLRGGVEIRDVFVDVLAGTLPGLRVGRPHVPVTGVVEVAVWWCGPRRRLPMTLTFDVDGGRISRLVGREYPAEPLHRAPSAPERRDRRSTDRSVEGGPALDQVVRVGRGGSPVR